MALTVAEVVGQFKADVGRTLSAEFIERACRNVGHTFRKRILDPVTLIHTFLLQILHGNVACTALPHLTGKSFSATAYTNARAQLPLTVLADLLERVVDNLFPLRQTTGLWRGHRTWLLDGSSFSMADRPELQKHFGQPGGQKKGCGFPVAHLLALFHAGTGFLQRVVAAPLRTHDMAQATRVHPEMAEGDILVADRGFASYAHLALVSQQKMHAVFRCHHRQIVDFRPGRRHTSQGKPRRGLPRSVWLKRLGRHDQLVEYTRPKQRPTWMSAEDFAALPKTLVVREIRFPVTKRGRRTRAITLTTTLLDPKVYPAAALAELYEQRWQVETNLRHLKTTMKMEILHCHSVEGVLKELTMFALAYNLVRLVMVQAARRQETPLDRISFIDALRWLRTATPGTPLPNLITNPLRPDRVEPRVVKRRPKEYCRMTKPRDRLQKALVSKRHAA
jgi:hypothetical protein